MEPVNPEPQEQHQQSEQPLTMAAVREMLDQNNRAWETRLEAAKASASAETRVRAKAKAPPTSEAVALQQEWERKQSEKAINQSLALGMEALGTINPGNVSKYFKSNYGDRIQVSDDGEVLFQESDNKVTPLKDYLQAWSKSDEGQTFVPARRGPQSIAGGFSGAPVSSASPYRAMTFEQIMERRRIDPVGVGAYMSAYESEFHQKRTEHTRGYVNR